MFVSQTLLDKNSLTPFTVTPLSRTLISEMVFNCWKSQTVDYSERFPWLSMNTAHLHHVT